MEHGKHFPQTMEMYMAYNTALTSMKIQQKQFQAKHYEHCWSTHGISPDIMKSNVLSHLKFPLGKETVPLFIRKQFLHCKDTPDRETDPFTPGNQFLQSHKNFTMETILQPFVDDETGLSTLGTCLQPFDNSTSMTSLKLSEKPIVSICMLTLTVGANPEWQPMNREEHSNKAFNSSELSGSICNKLDHPRKNTSQQEQNIRLTGQINIELVNDNQNLLLDLSDSWHHVETLPINSRHISNEHGVTVNTRIQAHHGSRYRNPVPDHLLPGLSTHYSTAISPRFEIIDTLWYMHMVPERPKKEAHIPPETSACVYSTTYWRTRQQTREAWRKMLNGNQHQPSPTMHPTHIGLSKRKVQYNPGCTNISTPPGYTNIQTPC